MVHHSFAKTIDLWELMGETRIEFESIHQGMKQAGFVTCLSKGYPYSIIFFILLQCTNKISAEGMLEK